MSHQRVPVAVKTIAWILTPVAVLLGSVVISRATIDTSWITSGQQVSASKLKAALDDAEKRLAALEAKPSAIDSNAKCPEGYALASGSPVLSTKGVDEIVKVGVGSAAFWIDRYEAIITQNADGSGTQYGISSDAEYPAGFAKAGPITTELFALSVPGKKPSAYMTWFQAQSACRASGKRLPTDEEWLYAGQNTNDPGAHDATGGLCNTQSSGPRNTGGGTACVSRWGAQDMIGNVWEWTANWYAAPGVGTPASMVAVFPNGDITGNVASVAYDSFTSKHATGMPAAALRGGYWTNGALAGLFALALDGSPTYWTNYIGFRCVLPF